jgi:N4-gp56 family major capsid protein
MTLTAAEVMEALSTLETNNARPIQGANYVGIIHPKTKFDLMQDSTFINTALYATEPGKNNPLATYKFATWLGVDWYVSSRATDLGLVANTSSERVMTTLILGKNAYGIGGLAGDMFGSVPATTAGGDSSGTGKKVNPVSMIIKPVGGGGAEDPLNQRGSIGWKTTFVAKILNQDFMVAIRHGVSLG